MAIITSENLALVKSRLLSLAWRLGWTGILALADLASNSLGLFNLPAWAIAVLGGYLLPEVSKFVQKKQQLLQARKQA